MDGIAINLRIPEPEDIDFILSLENEESSWSVSSTYIPFTRFAVEQYVLSTDHDLYVNGQLRLLIESVENNLLVGCVDLFEFDPRSRRVGVGILIHPEYRQRGFAAQALRKVVELAFERLGLHQVYCTIHQENESSIRLFESLGFVKQGIKKDWSFYDGNFHDVIFYQLINPKER